uniref:THD domain-containing protein n=2 Tax=Pyxicephalus adspersus TaxID=30357 RepID=A0AAV3A4Y5_PYXAD|nr:TPA: hypothetical protein GDO54_018286 [Pyxicephalus adspersus]
MTQYQINVQHAQDRRVKRLQWAVIGCGVILIALLCLTVYQMFGNFIFPKPEKMERCPQISELSQKIKSIKPRAHLTATSQSTLRARDNVLQWESTNGLAYVEDGMQYENKSLQIPKQGYYFVYSQVSLKIPPNFGDHFKSQIIRVNDNYGEPEVLLSGKAIKNGQHTIYLAGLLRLTRGDRLKVDVTAVDQVDISSEDKTFFGAFWVMGTTTNS